MKRFLKVLTGLICLLTMPAYPLYAMETVRDNAGGFSSDPGKPFECGFNTLSDQEKAGLNALLDSALPHGARQADTGTSPAYRQHGITFTAPRTNETEADIAYKTIIDSDEGTTLRLLNGAEVETTSECYGGAGYKKHAILYTRHGQWKILIEGKTPLDCTMNKMPVYGVPCVVEELTITEIKGQGDRPLLVMADGSIYEPKNVYPLTRSVWARSPRGLLMNGYELINLGRERERIEVTKVR